jgi:predicted nicotinamide N-methyase
LGPHRTTTVPEAKADPVLRRYELRRLRLPVGAEVLSLVLPCAAAMLREGQWAAATERGAEPPYWVQVWPASVAIARLLVRRGALHGQRVLDLGCGLGVPGIAAAHAGATVHFADREPDALAFAAWNATRLATAATPVVHRVDWATANVAGEFDVLVLADVSYRPVHHLALQRHIEHCLAAGGVVVHADPHRRESSPFVRWLAERHALATSSRPTTLHGKCVDVRLCVAAHDEQLLATWARAMGESVVVHGAGAARNGNVPAQEPASFDAAPSR